MANGPVTGEVPSRERREYRADGYPHWCRNLKTCVALPEQYTRSRQRVQRQKARGGQEGERDIKQPGVSAASRGFTSGVSQDR